MQFLSLLLGTIVLRPYVFIFLLIYLIASASHLGIRKTITFTVVGYALTWLSEFSSIHWGVPYGLYRYIDSTKGQELWVFGVPFMDSLSYVFLTYCSYSMALFMLSPLYMRGHEPILLETKAIRASRSVLLMSALFMAFLDIVIDPVALRGDRWFLGKIHAYAQEGIYFGIPLSNFIGWFVMGFVLTYALQQIDRFIDKDIERSTLHIPFRSLLGPILYICIFLFNLAVTFWIGERLLGYIGLLIFIQPFVMIFLFLIYKKDRLMGEDIEKHLRDFPNSPMARYRSMAS